ncbi:MAG: endonuclease/exonuclease/phosphatase family protein [Acidimicrobiia bacterium]
MLRVLTANLLGDRSSPLALARLLEENSPDVVAVQELAPSNAAVIRSLYPAGTLRPALGTDGMGLVSRLPIEVRRLPLPRRSALLARVTLPDGSTVEVWNAHLANPIGMPPPVGIRRAQVRLLCDALDRVRAPLVLVGDLNASPRWPAYKRLRTRLADGVADWAEDTRTRPPRTWSYRPGLPRLLRIDHALVRAMSVEDVRLLSVSGSDHGALVVDLVPEGAIGLRGDVPVSSR